MNANNIPAGFVLVPREPTLDMYNAAVLAYQNWHAAEVPDSIFTHTDVWNAMIAAAAPTPPVQEPAPQTSPEVCRPTCELFPNCACAPAPQAVVREASAFAMREVLSELLAIDTAVDHWMEDKKPRSQLLRSITDNIRSLINTLTPSPAPSAAPQADALRMAMTALQHCIEVIEACQEDNPRQRFPLTLDAARVALAALAQQQAPQQGEPK